MKVYDFEMYSIVGIEVMFGENKATIIVICEKEKRKTYEYKERGKVHKFSDFEQNFLSLYQHNSHKGKSLLLDLLEQRTEIQQMIHAMLQNLQSRRNDWSIKDKQLTIKCELKKPIS